MAIVSRDSAGTNNNLSVLTDHLGSVVGILDESGNPAIGESFAAYGERRDPTDWQGPIGNESAIAALTQRGFTGQTHLDASRLIHFGGRVLDAQFGRFLSADPNVPDPGSTQSFNRYSYTQNNPLSRLDPGGFVDISLGGFAENFNVSVSWRFGRRYTYQAPQTGCMVANAIGCYGPAPVKALLEVIVDKVIGPLPSYGWDDSLILYFFPPDPTIYPDQHPVVRRVISIEDDAERKAVIWQLKWDIAAIIKIIDQTPPENFESMPGTNVDDSNQGAFPNALKGLVGGHYVKEKVTEELRRILRELNDYDYQNAEESLHSKIGSYPNDVIRSEAASRAISDNFGRIAGQIFGVASEVYFALDEIGWTSKSVQIAMYCTHSDFGEGCSIDKIDID